MLREYLQHKILADVFSSPYGHQLSFIGGTAIRIIFGSDRFSEDIDFDNWGLSTKEFAALVAHVEKNLEKEGLEVETRNVFEGAYRCYLKIPKLLFDYQLSPLREEKILIQLDTTPKKFKFQPEIKTLNKFGIFQEIRVNPPDILLAQKIHALLHRQTLKGRDIYDLVFLASFAQPNQSYLKKVLDLPDWEATKTAIQKRLEKHSLKALAKDVRPFVRDKSSLARIEKFDQWLEE